MNITIAIVGKTKKNYWQEAEQEYVKRLSSFVTISQTIIKSRTHEQGQNTEVVKEKEGEEIIKKLNTKDVIISLDETGKELTSKDIADYLSKWQQEGARITFIIGGTHGLTQSVREKSDEVWSMSRLTFTHEMVRTVLLEQLYRGFTIINSIPYHY